MLLLHKFRSAPASYFGHHTIYYTYQLVLVAQLDRASDCGSEGRGFKSLQGHCSYKLKLYMSNSERDHMWERITGITGSSNPSAHEVDKREGLISPDFARAVQEVEHPRAPIMIINTQSDVDDAHAA